MNDMNEIHPNPSLRTVQIAHLDRKGQGQGTSNTGGTLTVPYSIPGETVEALKLRRKEARLLRVLEASPHRVEPVCAHFQHCGGCSWQHIDYAQQVEIKRERVAQRFRDHSLLAESETLDIVTADPLEYRNRMDFLWWHDGRFGLRERGKWYSAVNLTECRLLPDSVMQVALEVNRRVQEAGLPFRDTKRKTPGLRYLVIRRGVFTDEIMLSLVTDEMFLPPALWEGLENVVSVYQLINDNPENDNSDGVPIHLWGEPFYRERIGEREFQVGPRSFFQPNPMVAESMVNHVRHLISSLKAKRGLIDLYCGIGLFAVSLGDQFERIIGVESNQEAVALAKRNAQDLPIVFACVDAEKWSWPSREVDVLLVDPPRTGLHPRVVQTLKEQPLHDLFYVSCNPVRGVEDIVSLRDTYELVSTKLFDQFPQTVHIEMIAHLQRKA